MGYFNHRAKTKPKYINIFLTVVIKFSFADFNVRARKRLTKEFFVAF